MTIPEFTPFSTVYPNGHGTSEDKRKFAEHFMNFVEGGYKRTKFTQNFYRRLSNTFGHIAHNDIDGFYQTWFESKAAQREFISHCLAYPCYGSARFTFSDVEAFLKDWIRTEIVPAMGAVDAPDTPSETSGNTGEVEFKIAAVSRNRNSFGLQGHIAIARDGRVIEFAANDLNALPPGSTLKVREVEGRLQIPFELPKERQKAPQAVVDEVFAIAIPA
jgi:hypothetical protein